MAITFRKLLKLNMVQMEYRKISKEHAEISTMHPIDENKTFTSQREYFQIPDSF